MKAIRNFIYLDEYKMYSLSSQVFEGITEYLIDYKRQAEEEQQGQKGPLGSGRIMADIIRRGSGTQEKRFLHDYSYHLFEEHLSEQGKVVCLDAKSSGSLADSLSSRSFVRITSKATLNDIKSLMETIKNFNKLGEAFAYVTNIKAIEEVKAQLELAQSNIKDRNQRAALQQKLRSLTNIPKLAKEKGLQQDQTFLDDLSLLFTYGFQDQLEARMEIRDTIFSANLKRDCLRESEALLIRKYSRTTEKEFVMFGTVTQSSGSPPADDSGEEQQYASIKEALMALVIKLSIIEGSFTGRLPNEVIIDPIALYTEL